jgi:phenylpropionate dioxygenase-like ring-hydroxylating dioxygenase large terminal subunit
MEQHVQIELLRRAAQHLLSGTTDSSPRATRYSARIYADEQQLRAERSTLFSRFPVLVAYSAQLRNAGDYVTHEWCGVPILVCRQEDGGARAFLNVCRHRGAKVATLKAGHTNKLFVCRYHAWSYDMAGRLHGLPCASHFAEVDKERNGLCELPVIEDAGLVFVVPTRGMQHDSDAYFGQYLRELRAFGLEDYELYAVKTVFGNVNWKMMIEANQESYHINFLHRDTAGPRFMAQLSLFDTLGPHTRTLLLHKQFSAQSVAGESSEWRVLDHGDLVYFLFPNTLILLSTLAAHVLTAFPQGTGKTVVQGATLVPKGTLESFPRPYYEKYWATILEDISVSESIQFAAQADTQLKLWLGGNECLLNHFHGAIRRAASGELTLAAQTQVAS